MVTKCANASCDTSFRYLRGGKLFIHEPKSVRPLRDVEFQERCQHCEYFWLCEQCARTMSVTLDRNGYKVVPCHPNFVNQPEYK
jgi:hypothetical protein